MRLSLKNLPFQGKRKKAERNERPAKAPRGLSIEKRPADIAERKSFGHWEMDCVCSIKDTKPTIKELFATFFTLHNELIELFSLIYLFKYLNKNIILKESTKQMPTQFRTKKNASSLSLKVRVRIYSFLYFSSNFNDFFVSLIQNTFNRNYYYIKKMTLSSMSNKHVQIESSSSPKISISIIV